MRATGETDEDENAEDAAGDSGEEGGPFGSTELEGWEDVCGEPDATETDGCEEGFEAWCDWLRRSGSFSRAAAERSWRRYSKSQPSRIGLGSLIFYADHADPQWRVRLWLRWSMAS